MAITITVKTFIQKGAIILAILKFGIF